MLVMLLVVGEYTISCGDGNKNKFQLQQTVTVRKFEKWRPQKIPTIAPCLHLKFIYMYMYLFTS